MTESQAFALQNENKRAVVGRRGGGFPGLGTAGAGGPEPTAEARGGSAPLWAPPGAVPGLPPPPHGKAGRGRAGRGGRLSCGAPHMTGAPSPAGKGSEGRRRRRMAAGWGRALLPPAALLVLAPLVLAPDPVSPRARPRPGGAAEGTGTGETGRRRLRFPSLLQVLGGCGGRQRSGGGGRLLWCLSGLIYALPTRLVVAAAYFL